MKIETETEIEIAFTARVIKSTLFVAALCSIALGYAIDFFYGLGIFAGALWGCTNLFLIKHLLTTILTSKINYFTVYAMLGIKFPLLYLAGYGLLKNGYLPTYSLLVGFSLIILLIFLECLKTVVIEKIAKKMG